MTRAAGNQVLRGAWSPEGSRARFDRWLAFNAVGLPGLLVQLTALAFLVDVLGCHYLVATAIAVEAAVLHNFAWHERWTWRDRTMERRGKVGRLVGFNVTTGLLSVVGNLIIMQLLVSTLGVPYLPANLLAIGACSLLNFAACERLVFGPRSGAQPRGIAGTRAPASFSGPSSSSFPTSPARTSAARKSTGPMS